MKNYLETNTPMRKIGKVIFPIVMLALFFSACAARSQPAPSEAQAEQQDETTAIKKTLSPFNLIDGTDYLMAGIIPDENREGSFDPFQWINSGGYSSRYSSYTTYNYVFFNTADATYLRLLPTNEYAIIETAGFPQQIYDPTLAQQPPAPIIETWLYKVVKADSNADKILDGRDLVSIAISDVGGNGYTELIENVDEIISQYNKDNFNLFIFYKSGGKNFAASINLITRKLIITTEMDLGEDVQ